MKNFLLISLLLPSMDIVSAFQPLGRAALSFHQREQSRANSANSVITTSTQQWTTPSSASSSSSRQLGMSNDCDMTDEPSCWNPILRRNMGVIAGAGVLETAYLTFTKLTGGSVTALCGTDGGCGNVLNGPYSVIPGTDLPLALLGLMAYSVVAFLAVAPMVSTMDEETEENNRVLLTSLSTTMGVFSVFLMSILFGVLGESCNFCIASAIFSISLAKLSWLGGAVPGNMLKQGIKLSTGGGLAAFLAAALLFASVPESASASFGLPPIGSSDTVAVADKKGTPPPPIVSKSSARSLAIAADLESLDARMFGAFWCSHCYDQKDRLGKEAMMKVPYIECSKDGLNSQNALCKERDVPGYPTWEIKGKLYPGEKELDELEEIIKEAKSS